MNRAAGNRQAGSGAGALSLCLFLGVAAPVHADEPPVTPAEDIPPLTEVTPPAADEAPPASQAPAAPGEALPPAGEMAPATEAAPADETATTGSPTSEAPATDTLPADVPAMSAPGTEAATGEAATGEGPAATIPDTYTLPELLPAPPATATATQVDPAQLRGSLSVRSAPMSQVLTLLGAMTPLRFRYASPPDAVLTAEWKNALLLPSLDKVLRGARWRMQRNALDLFMYRAAESNAAATATPQGWQYWSGATPPPRRWMAVPPVPAPSSATMRKPASKSAAPAAAARPQTVATQPGGTARVVARWRFEQTGATSASWRNAPLDIDAAQRPGVRVFVPRSVPVPGAVPTADDEAGPVWLRWRLPLGFVPPGAQLLLETPVAATLYVNGAPLLSRRSGINIVDLSRVLVRGENYLALHMASVPAELRSAPTAVAPAGVASSVVTRDTRPLLRYEWQFNSSLNGTVAPSD